eukprot:754529-Hanusia_phi.AAC.1
MGQMQEDSKACLDKLRYRCAAWPPSMTRHGRNENDLLKRAVLQEQRKRAKLEGEREGWKKRLATLLQVVEEQTPHARDMAYQRQDEQAYDTFDVLMQTLEEQVQALNSEYRKSLFKVTELHKSIFHEQQAISRECLDESLSKLEHLTSNIANSLGHISKSQLMMKKTVFEESDVNLVRTQSQSLVTESFASRGDILVLFDLFVPTVRQVATIFNVHQLAACELLSKLSAEREELKFSVQSLSRSFANTQNALKLLHTSAASIRSLLREKSSLVSKNMIVPVSSINQISQPASLPDDVVYERFFNSVDAVLTVLARLGADWSCHLQAENDFLRQACLQGGGRKSDLMGSNERLERSLLGLVQAAETLQNRMNATDRRDKVQFLSMMVREGVENVGDVVVLMVEFVHSLEYKNDCDRLAGLQTSKQVADRMTRSSSDLCDVITKFHMSLYPQLQRTSGACRISCEEASQSSGKKELGEEMISLNRQLAEMHTRSIVIAADSHLVLTHLYVVQMFRARDEINREEMSSWTSGDASERMNKTRIEQDKIKVQTDDVVKSFSSTSKNAIVPK